MRPSVAASAHWRSPGALRLRQRCASGGVSVAICSATTDRRRPAAPGRRQHRNWSGLGFVSNDGLTEWLEISRSPLHRWARSVGSRLNRRGVDHDQAGPAVPCAVRGTARLRPRIACIDRYRPAARQRYAFADARRIRCGFQFGDSVEFRVIISRRPAMLCSCRCSTTGLLGFLAARRSARTPATTASRTSRRASVGEDQHRGVWWRSPRRHDLR